MEQYNGMLHLPKFKRIFSLSFYHVILLALLVQNKGMENQNTKESKKTGERKVFLYWSRKYLKGMLD